MSYPFMDSNRAKARGLLGAAVGFAVTVMALVAAGLIAWIKWGGSRRPE